MHSQSVQCAQYVRSGVDALAAAYPVYLGKVYSIELGLFVPSRDLPHDR